MSRNILLSLCFLCATAVASAQGPSDQKSIPISKVERKGKAPVSSEVLRVKLPKPAEFKLDNGLAILILEDHRLLLVTLHLIIPGAGSMDEPLELPGLASFTAQMLKEGTATRSSKQIAEEMERLGASINATAPFGSDETTLTASGLSDKFGQWVALAADVLLQPTFPKEELDKLKQRQKAALMQQRSTPAFLQLERFSKALYGDHPASVVTATAESIDAMTPELLAKWHREHYVPQNAILGIAGDVNPSELLAMFSTMPVWEAGNTALKSVAATKAVGAKHVYIVERPGSVQTDVALGNVAVTRTDPDYVAMTVLDRIVGGGPSARLFLNLREEKGYTYGVYSALDARKYAGPWFASGNMRTEVTGGAMDEFMKEIRRIRDDKVPEAELEEQKRALVAAFALSLEDPDQLLEYALTRKIYGLPEDYWDTYPAKISNITAEQVQRVAKKYLDPDAIQIVAVGDAAKIRPMLEKFGPVEVFDAQGKPAK